MPSPDLKSHLKLQLLLKSHVLYFPIELVEFQLLAIHHDVKPRAFLRVKAGELLDAGQVRPPEQG